MTNWKEYGVPFGEFTKEITREWVYNGFSKEECKERLESGMIKEDANFCYWLENESEVEYEYPLDNNQKENLRKEYEKYSISQDTNTDWRDIHQGFTKKLQKSWKECNFNRKQQVRKWIRIGLQPTDYEFANYLRMEGFQAESSSNLTKLREKYYNWKGGNNQIQRHLLGLFQNQEIVKEIEALQTDERIKRAKLKKYYNYKAEKLSPDYIALQSVTKLWLKAGFTIGEMQQLIKFGFRLSEYQEAKQWKDKGFTFTQVSRWISVGLKTNEYDFAIYLTKKGFQPSTSNIKEVIINETWQNIHSSFSYHQRKEWEEEGFNYEETKKLIEIGFERNGLDDAKTWKDKGFSIQQIEEWINFGMKPQDVNYCTWLRDVKNKDAKWVFADSIENRDLKERYEKYELCLKCNQPNTKKMWCQPCDLKYFRQNFKNWASSSDKIISESAKKILEWIPYEQLRNIKYLSKGGFGTIFKAEWINNKAIEHWKTEFNQWEEDKFKNYVALKVLDNSQNIKVDFLKETICYKLTKDNIYIVKCHGISQDPKSKNYIMVMDYIPHGDLRKYLQNNYNNLDFRDKIDQLYSIASGLSSIHEKELLHRDFHSGNILNDGRYNYITDLGLCRPVNEKDERNKVYGVLPYVAPEVLRGEKYTQASDIYSFGIIAYEVFFGKSPYSEFAHDEFLAMKICQGLRPNLDCIKIPKKCENLIKKCWDAEPNKRLSAAEITRVLESWKSNYSKTNSKFYKQFKRIERVEKLGNNLMSFSYQTHPQAIYTSRLLEFKSLPEPQNSQEINDQFYSNSLQVNFMKLNLLEEKDEEIATVNFRATAKTEKLITRNKRQLSLTSQNEPLPLTKSTKLTSLLERVNIEEKQEFQPEPMEIDDNNQDWRNINSNFTDELIHSWQSHRFSPSQTQDWLSIGLQPTDSHLAAWLRDELRLTPEQLLNDHTTNLADLREQFTEYQTYQEQPPKN